jgi:hypothetical protein
MTATPYESFHGNAALAARMGNLDGSAIRLEVQSIGTISFVGGVAVNS